MTDQINPRRCAKRKFKLRSSLFAGVCLFAFAAALTLSGLHSPARTVAVYYNGLCQPAEVTATDVEGMLEQAGIEAAAGEYDYEQTEEGEVLRVSPLFTLTVRADGETKTLTARTNTVQSALDSLGVTVGRRDLVTPAVDTIYNENCDIVVQRVRFTRDTVTEPVAYGVTYEETASLPKGQTRVKTAGANGSQTVVYNEKWVDGERVERTALSATLAVAPKDEVVLRGTKVYPKGEAVTTDEALNEKLVSPLCPDQPIAVDDDGRPLSYRRQINGIATAYTASEGGLTSTGPLAQLGYIAVDPSEIPYGTMMYIKTADGSYYYGYAKAADTGGFISGPVTVDLYFSSEAECRQFGVRDVEIYIL